MRASSRLPCLKATSCLSQTRATCSKRACSVPSMKRRGVASPRTSQRNSFSLRTGMFKGHTETIRWCSQSTAASTMGAWYDKTKWGASASASSNPSKWSSTPRRGLRWEILFSCSRATEITPLPSVQRTGQTLALHAWSPFSSPATISIAHHPSARITKRCLMSSPRSKSLLTHPQSRDATSRAATRTMVRSSPIRTSTRRHRVTLTWTY